MAPPDPIPPTYFELDVDVGDSEEGEIAEVHADMLIQTGTGLELVTQKVKAKGGRTLADQLFVVGSTPLLLSENAYEKIRAIRMCPGMEWHPVEVTWRRSSYAYWVGETCAEHDIWDYDKSDYALLEDDLPRGNDNVGYLRRGVADRTRLPPLDLFRSRFNCWIGSGRLKEIWQAARLTGMKFTELGRA